MAAGRPPVAAAALALVATLAGCAPAAGDAQLRDLRARLDASEQSRADMARKLEELDNRVFLLTDQVESQKVALGQRGGEPRLPVVTLAPAPPGPRDTVIGTDQPEAPAELDPPTTIRSGPSRGTTIRLEGEATPWLDHGEGGGAAPRAHSVASASSAPVVAGRRARPLSPPVEQGLGVTRGKPPLVDEVVLRGGATPASSLPIEHAAAEHLFASGGDPTALYRAAYARLKAGQAEQAAEEFRGLVRRFPHHDLADNAQYWLAETFYLRAAYREAEPEFRAVIRRWPTGNKAPDALLKLGYCLLAEGDATLGRSTLLQVVEHYPRTEAAALAQKRLAELPTEAPR